VRVLVTGGAGFIGSTLVDRLLAEGCDVDAIDDLSTGALVNLADARAQRNRKFSFHRLDVRSPQLADVVVHRRPEVIFHLAAQLDVRASVKRPIHDAEVNILGSLNVCEAALAGGTSKVVFAGSGGTLYGVPETVPVRESHPQRPVSPYGVSKKAVGDYLHFYREVHGLEYTELALANVYGPRQDPNGEAGAVAIFAGQLLAGRRPTIYGDGTQTRDYLFVDDAVDAFVRAAERGGGLLMNIGTGVETSVLDMALGIAERVRSSAIALLDVGARPYREGEAFRVAIDVSRAKEQLGFTAEVSLDVGLTRMVEALTGVAPADVPVERAQSA
jgi:UDP-glucose 4-epimerase